jgi:diguanylate cyclase (GGDEF)-like protein
MAITRAERFQEKIAVFMLDLDKFKDVNDTLGHTVGDHLLKTVADRLSVSLRKSDTVARMGGDEFIICVPDIKERGTPAQVAEKILENFISPFVFDSHEISTKASIGLALYPEDGADGEMLIRNADIAMYRAKHAGGNLFKSYS